MLVSEAWCTKAGWDGPNKCAEVRDALSQGADVNAVSDDGRTVLMNACAFCVDPDCVSFLLSKGASPHTADKDGRTALVRHEE